MQQARKAVSGFAVVLTTALLTSCGGGQAPIPQSATGGPQGAPLKSRVAPLSGSSRLHSQYKLVDTGTLGGPNDSLGFEGERDLNNDGQLVDLDDLAALSSPPFCFAVPPDCHLTHPAIWSDQELRDLGTLAVGYSGGPIWISDRGRVSGFAQTGQLDPLTNMPQYHAVLYAYGRVVDLGTLGGYESTASGINDAGLISGCATTTKSDPYQFCPYPGATKQASRAVIWRDGKIHDLGTLGGPDALAELVNDRGDVVGWSLTDYQVNPSTGIPTQHPFLWRNGKMHDLGTIGGTAVPLVNDLNERGEFVGSMTVAGDQSFHPFLWNGTTLKDLGTLGGADGQANWISDKGSVVGAALNAQGSLHAFFWSGTMNDIGTLAGDQCSIAYGINSRGQTVGGSWPDGNCYAASSRAFVYERGEIVDLNQLIDSNHRAQLTVAVTINERGEIAAQGMFPNGDIHGFLLIPTGRQQTAKPFVSTWKTPPSLMLPNGPSQGGPAGMIAAFRAHRYYSRFSAWHAAGGFSP